MNIHVHVNKPFSEDGLRMSISFLASHYTFCRVLQAREKENHNKFTICLLYRAGYSYLQSSLSLELISHLGTDQCIDLQLNTEVFKVGLTFENFVQTSRLIICL